MNDKQDMNEPAKKPVAHKSAPAPKAPAPTQEELSKAFEELVVQAEAAGQRDDPVIVNARSLLDRKSA